MSETMYLTNHLSHEFLDDEEAFTAYLEVVVPADFEEIAQEKGLHLVPGTIRERRSRQELGWMETERGPVLVALKGFLGQGVKPANLTQIHWTAEAA